MEKQHRHENENENEKKIKKKPKLLSIWFEAFKMKYVHNMRNNENLP